MFVSIIIPLYNKEKYIERTINSVLSQSFKDFELLIINDGSTDDSFHIVQNIHDNRLRIINKQNEGVSATRNRGMAEALGEYLLFLDADDTLEKCALDTFYKATIKYNNFDLYVASFVERDTGNHIIYKMRNRVEGYVQQPLSQIWKENLVVRLGNFIVKRTLAISCGRMYEKICLYEDFEWIIRICANGTVFSMNNCVLSYNRGTDGLSRKIPPINKEYASLIKLSTLDGHIKKIMAEHCLKRIIKRLLTFDFKGAGLLLRNNIVQIPYMIYSYLFAKI